MVFRTLLLLALLSWVTPPVIAQDPSVADPTHVKVEFENDQVRITRTTYSAGYTTPHTHELPSVSVSLTTVKTEGANGITERPAGNARFAEPNTTPHETKFLADLESVRVELKAKGTRTLPIPATNGTNVDAAHHEVEFENDRVRIVRVTYPAGYKTPMHSHLAGVNVQLTGGTLLVSTLSEKYERASGQVGWADGTTAHTSENVGSAMSRVLVELKTAP